MLRPPPPTPRGHSCAAMPQSTLSSRGWRATMLPPHSPVTPGMPGGSRPPRPRRRSRGSLFSTECSPATSSAYRRRTGPRLRGSPGRGSSPLRRWPSPMPTPTRSASPGGASRFSFRTGPALSASGFWFPEARSSAASITARKARAPFGRCTSRRGPRVSLLAPSGMRAPLPGPRLWSPGTSMSSSCGHAPRRNPRLGSGSSTGSASSASHPSPGPGTPDAGAKDRHALTP